MTGGEYIGGGDVTGHMVTDYTDTEIVREETYCRHMGYSFRLAARGSFICIIP